MSKALEGQPSWLEKQTRDNVATVDAPELLTEYARAFERRAEYDADWAMQYKLLAAELRRLAAEF